MESLISVVIPVYNASKYVTRTLESVICQTYENIEILLIDDCSTDNSVEILRDYEKRDSRIKVFTSEKNQGVAAVRNRGIQAAKGEYIALLDSDDIWVDTKLEKQIESLRRTGAQISYCSYSFTDENDNEILRPFIVPEKTTYKQMLYCNYMSCSTVLIEASLLKKHPFKREFYHEDYVLWLELLSIPTTNVGIKEVLAYYRQVSGSRSHNKINAAKKRWDIYRNALDMKFIHSCFAMIGYGFNAIKKYRR